MGVVHAKVHVEPAEKVQTVLLQMFLRPIAMPLETRQAAAGVRQLWHGGGLRDGGPGRPALRGGPAAHRH